MAEKPMSFAPTPDLWQDGDVLAEFGNRQFATLEEKTRQAWLRLWSVVQNTQGAKPGAKFRQASERDISSEDWKLLAPVLQELFLFVAGCKEISEEKVIRPGTQYEYRYTLVVFLHDRNAAALKGLVWSCLYCIEDALLIALARMMERCFRKIPGKGYASGAVGNAALWVLAEEGSHTAVRMLSRMKGKSIQNNTRGLIDDYLRKMAEKSGITVEDLEDLAVPDFGLDGTGTVAFEVSGYRAVLRLVKPGKCEVEWFKPNGSPLKSPPSALKKEQGDALKEIAATAKDIASTSTAQRDRFDRMLRSGRMLSYEQLDKIFLQHGLLGWLSRQLIWHIENGKQSARVFFTGSSRRDSRGATVGWIGSGCRARLWHPAESPVDEILRWRAFFEEMQIVQPMKQAFREIYLLTEAELRTRNYSNRFAAHLLKQHQFASLARIRGWHYTLLGAYDDGRYNSAASLHLPEHQIRAEYWVNEVNADDAWNDTGIWLYVSTDQVRFYRQFSETPLDLIDVPPVVLSEVMRDVDMFVGVASIGNDPTWMDGGGLRGYQNYWQQYSFGDLSELAKSRRDILTRLVPRLKIAPVAEVRDRFLVVKGKLRTYKIHLGSSNILMEPNDQYLCIVPDRKLGENSIQNKVFLPFEGDSVLALILSKAMLLAEDDLITDETITRQIGLR